MTLLIMKHLICVTLVLSIALLSQQHGVYGFYIKSQDLSADIVAPKTPTTTLTNEGISILSPLAVKENIAGMEYKDLNDYENQPNFLIIWPSLSELLLTPSDYDDIEASVYENPMKDASRKELFNLRFLKKLKLIAQVEDDVENKRENEPSVPEFVPKRIKSNYKNLPFINDSIDLNALALKQHGIKKNVQWPLKNTIVRKAARKQYMSPCHFKICNMGRKRHARY